ncbi:MAG: hypothetical protein ACRD5B_17835, partial [Nitrososphaeraceae archaeon]
IRDITMKKTTISLLTVIAIVAVLPTSFVYAQTTTTATPEGEEPTTTTTTTSAPTQLVTPSAAAQQIINNTQAECKQAEFLQPRCVNLVYESPTTVVLSGLIKIFGGTVESPRNYQNPFLWNAVDDFKAQGYTITAIEMNVVSNRTSDNEYHVIMSK